MLSQAVSSTIFKVFGMTWPGIEPRSSGTLANTLSTGPMSRWLSKAGDRSRKRPEGSLFNSYYTEVSGRALLLSLDCSTLPLIRTFYCWVLSKDVSSTIFKVSWAWRDLGLNPALFGHWRNFRKKRNEKARIFGSYIMLKKYPSCYLGKNPSYYWKSMAQDWIHVFFLVKNYFLHYLY